MLSQLINYSFIALALGLLGFKIKYRQESKKRSRAEEDDEREKESKYQSLRRRFFVAYLLALFGDWLQGPYVYKLYSDYGYRENQASCTDCEFFIIN